MLAKLRSVALTGIDAEEVGVELDLSPGLPGLRIVGLPDKAVQESVDRVRSAIRNSNYQYPVKKMVVNLAPAEIKKEGTVYDLPLALAILKASEQLLSETVQDYLIIGELSLDGQVRPVRGALAAAITARQRGAKGIILPKENACEAAVLQDEVSVVAVSNLQEAALFLAGEIPAPPMPEDVLDPEEMAEVAGCFSEVRGQNHVKRALEVAAAGGHNALMLGPPGSGKTMSARRLPSILPELTFSESLQTTKIYSVAGELRPGQGLMRHRPFRSPHHSVSAPGLIGGGTYPRPGEISLSHNGVLFLDEAPEFSRNILETLRQPLEDGWVTISRAASTQTYPARMMLVMSMNMCPCGRLGASAKACHCTPQQIAAYVGKLSGPLLDRIDIHIEVPALKYDEIRSGEKGETSAAIRQRVVDARKIQTERLGKRDHAVNASMTPSEIDKYCILPEYAETLLRTAVNEFGLSARAYTRILKVARTIADLAGATDIDVPHISEAIQYRVLDRKDSY